MGYFQGLSMSKRQIQVLCLVLCQVLSIIPMSIINLSILIKSRPVTYKDMTNLLLIFQKNYIIQFSQTIVYLKFQVKLSLLEINKRLQNDRIVKIEPEFINPFAIGHLINHPGPDQPANVMALDLVIPNHFFPLEYQKFLPYLKFQNDYNTQLKEHYHNDCIRGVGIFALREIKDGEELFLDYFHSKLCDMEKRVPDWLLKPPAYAPYLVKHDYEIKFGFFTNLIDNYMADKNIYMNFQNTEDNLQKGAIQDQIDKKIGNKL